MGIVHLISPASATHSIQPLAMGWPGDIIRNPLLEPGRPPVWTGLDDAIESCFGHALPRPNAA